MKFVLCVLLLVLSQLVSSDTVIIGAPQTFTAYSKVIFEIKYVTQKNPLIAGERISIQLPPFWQRPSPEPAPSGFPPVSVRFSHPETSGKLSVSTTGIDGYSSTVGISVINIDILSSENWFLDDTITVTVGAEPVADKGIRVTFYSGEQRLFYARCRTNAIKSCASGNQFQTITVQPRKAKKILAVTGSRLRSFDSAYVKIALLDEYNNRDFNYFGPVQLYSSGGQKLWEGTAEQGLSLARVMPGSSKIDSFKITTNDGLTRWTNPFEITTKDSLRIWWGDPHTHAIYSGHGRGYIQDLLEYAQHSSLLDFVAYTDHDWIDSLSFNEATKAINAAHRDHSFAALHGMEWTSRIVSPASGHGHLAVISPSDVPVSRMTVTTLSRPDQVFDMAKRHNYLVSVNHPVGTYAFDWNYYNKNVIRNVEMVSDGSLNISDRNNENLNIGYSGTAVKDLVRQGYQLGFLGVSDNHQSQPGIYSADVTRRSGLTAVIAEDLTRQQIVKQLIARHNYTTTGARIIIDVRSGNYRMGNIIGMQPGEGEKIIPLSIHVVGTSKISTVDIMKDGQSIYRFDNISTNVFDTVFSHRISALPTSYYIRVAQADGEKAWSSPIWYEVEGINTSSQTENSNSSFNVSTKRLDDRLFEIFVSIPRSTTLTVDVYDILGRKVSTIASDFFTSGPHTFYWRKDGRDGAPLANGMYLLRLRTEYAHRTEKLLILR